VEQELILRAARGDAEAFDALARDRIDRLFAIAVRILRDHHDAEDAVQQALWTAWADLPGLRDPERFDAWLYRLLVRGCFRAGRSRRRRLSLVRPLSDPDEAIGGADAPRDVEARDALDRAFALLGTEHRSVVVMHHYLGLPLEEIAEVLGVPSGTARSRLHYALRRLRAAIEPDDRIEPAVEASR
jgi:RNA polymerase sigma-70 factor, ECF subfamily